LNLKSKLLSVNHGPLGGGIMHCGGIMHWKKATINSGVLLVVIYLSATSIHAQPLELSNYNPGELDHLTKQQVIAETLKPYLGEYNQGVDASTLDHKVICGYQGWFRCEGDGAGMGWTHWVQFPDKMPGPNNIKVDMWPDVRELDPDELYDTEYLNPDGTVRQLLVAPKICA
jgi:hypothetical protein